jgi:lipopolysaccharide transport system ATP-binding protein
MVLQMSSNNAIKFEGISKSFQIYARPEDRLKQLIYPKLQKLNGMNPKQYYSQFHALDNISFEIKKGETVGIIGRNGSGKSTLLQIACGILNPTVGKVTVVGRVAALLELGSGFNPEFTGKENVYLNASVLGLTKQEIDLRYQQIVDFADIGDFIHQPTKTYSTGMVLRLAFAVIVHVDADILVIDEALAVGDTFFTQKCMRFLRNFMATGTLLFVSHDTAAVKSLCSRAIWVEKGAIIQEGPAKDVCESYLQAFYESQQGTSISMRIKAEPLVVLPNVYRDQRRDFINNSNARNDIEVFRFNPDAPSFGLGGASIVFASLFDKNGNPLSWVVGGEDVVLRVQAQAQLDLDAPIIGFHIKDGLGQLLFGDNTYLTYLDAPLSAEKGSYLVAEFHFQMPRLALGDYSLSVAIANGTQNEHIQHHWIHDALFFKSESTSICNGIIGIPMREIKLKVGAVL